MSLAAELMTRNAEITGHITPDYETILTPEAVDFVLDLEETFGQRVAELLEARVDFQSGLESGIGKLGFLKETKDIRESDWQVAPIPKDLQDRRVEITGPVDRKMMINALNSGAKVFMADIEDSLTPSWDNVVQGQINLRDAVNGTIHYASPEGKEYQLKGAYPSKEVAILKVRPRGWHLREKHILLG